MQYIAVVSKKPLRGGAKIGAEKESKIIKIKKKIYCVYGVLTCPFVYHSAFFQSVPALQGSIYKKNQVTSCCIYVRNTHANWCFPYSSVGKESTCNAGDPSSIPGSRRSSREGIGYPL